MSTPSDTDVVLDDGLRTWTRAALQAQVDALAGSLTARGTRVFATPLDNSPAWVAADLAAAQAGIVHVPLPVFFTPQQIGHALRSAGVDTLLTTTELAGHWPQAPVQRIEVAGSALMLVGLPAHPVTTTFIPMLRSCPRWCTVPVGPGTKPKATRR